LHAVVHSRHRKERLDAARVQASAMIPRALAGVPNRSLLPYM
jgi:hypothetical protein